MVGTTDSMTSEEYRKHVGAPADQPTEMSAAEFVRYLKTGPTVNPWFDTPTRVHSSEVDTEPTAKRSFREWIEVVSPCPVLTEVRRIPGRQYRFDWYLPDLKLAIEYDGVADHATVKGAWRDAEKGNLAQLEGILFIRVNAKSINDGSAYETVRKAIDLRRSA